MQKKNKLCKFKENCPQFLSGVSCGFDHVECKFKQSCKNRDTCLFYHPNNQVSQPRPESKSKFAKSKSETPCQFGDKCRNKAKCEFKHEPSQIQEANSRAQQESQPTLVTNQPQQKKMCKYGANCYRGANCYFQHPPKNDMSQENTGPVGQSSSRPHQRLPVSSGPNERVSKKLCYSYMMNNKCQNGAMCPKQHEFTEKGTVKRLFFSTDFPQEKCAAVAFFQRTKVDAENRIKEIVYVLQQSSWIDFKKLVSSDKIYEQIGEIGNNDNKFYLRSLKTTACDFGSNIQGIQSFSIQNSQFIAFVCSGNLNIFSVDSGSISQIELNGAENYLTGLVSTPNNRILVSFSNNPIVVLEYSSATQRFAKALDNSVKVPERGFKMLEQTAEPILGQKVVFGITSTNRLYFQNPNNLTTFHEVQIEDVAEIEDAEVCIIKNKFPVCLVTAKLTNNSNEVYAVNLLNFTHENLMTSQNALGKISVLENQLFLEVKNKGLLIYRVGEFESEVGLIPLRNEIACLKKDVAGNLLILENKNVEYSGSLSIFKVKRG